MSTHFLGDCSSEQTPRARDSKASLLAGYQESNEPYFVVFVFFSEKKNRRENQLKQNKNNEHPHTQTQSIAIFAGYVGTVIQIRL